jgi:hypothetical protein
LAEASALTAPGRRRRQHTVAAAVAGDRLRGGRRPRARGRRRAGAGRRDAADAGIRRGLPGLLAGLAAQDGDAVLGGGRDGEERHGSKMRGDIWFVHSQES